MVLLNPSWKRRLLRLGLVVLALGAGARSPLSAQAEASKEYKVKAVFLLNFTQFVQWPSDSFTGPEEPFCIGVLGNDPFGGFLEETVAGEKAGGRPLVVRRFSSVEEVRNCQLLFISRSERGRMRSILDGLKGRSILTVGDTPGFDAQGGIIRFVTENDRIHFRVNLETAKKDGLSISAQMLQLAEIVGPGKD